MNTINKQKITICSPQLGLSPKSTLGGEVFDREILLGLAAKGIVVKIILPKDKPHDFNIRNWYITFMPISHFPAIMANVFFLPQLISMYQKKEFDILRIHQPQFLGLSALFLKLINPKVKLVATIHQFREANFLIFSKLINKAWDQIICDSQNVKSLLTKTYDVSSKKIAVVHNGVPGYLKPCKKDAYLENKLKLKGKFVLMSMGVIEKRKNPMFLLEVLEELNKKSSDFVLIFWGKGPQMQEIKEKAKEKNLINYIRFVGPKYGSIKNNYHSLTDVFLHPSVDEGFALAPLEAMVCAKPVIMNDLHSAREAVDNGITGYLAKANNLEDWSGKLLKLKKNKTLLNKMSEKAYSKAKRDFNWGESVKKHQEVFKKLVQKN